MIMISFSNNIQRYLNQMITLISLALINESYEDEKPADCMLSLPADKKQSSAGDLWYNRSFIL